MRLKLCTVGHLCLSQWSWKKDPQHSSSSTRRRRWLAPFFCGSWSLSCPRGNPLTSGLQNLAHHNSAWHPLRLPFIYNNSLSIWRWGKNTLLTFLSSVLECYSVHLSHKQVYCSTSPHPTPPFFLTKEIHILLSVKF